MVLDKNVLNVLGKYFTADEIISLRNNNNLYEKCCVLVERLFEEITDKGGSPYVEHLYYVGNHLLPYGEHAAAAGLLHDILEDIEGMDTMILSFLQIPDDVIEILSFVTKPFGMPYNEYITRIIQSNNFYVLKLKEYDLAHNFNSSRLAKLDSNVRERLVKKYNPQVKRIRKVLERMNDDKYQKR